MKEVSDQLRYPIGRFRYEVTTDIRSEIERISALPELLKNAVSGLNEAQLDTPYRPAGWTVRQVIHHLPDSHINAYIRFKLALTEPNPIIRPYNEGLWAECEEARTGDIQMSVRLLESIHVRWVSFLKTLNENDYERTYHHPEQGRDVKLKEVLSLYAWHGEHHLAHITQTRNLFSL